MSTEKPKVLIMGGAGFIGRSMVKYLVDNKLCSFIKAADKKTPGTCAFHADHKAAFASSEVSFQQSDLSRDGMVAKLFTDVQYDYVINLCAETRPLMTELDYKQKILTAATTTAAVALTNDIKKWVEVSHGSVYAPDKTLSKEDAKVAPWTIQGRYRFMAEEALNAMDGLPVVTLRPAIVYGPGDLGGLTPRIACGAHYTYKKEVMKFLWGANLKINTVHVADVCKAIWHACTTLEAGTVYNLADSGDTTAGKMNKIMGSMFGCKHGFHNGLVSRAAGMALDQVAQIANNKHIPGFRDLCVEHKILNTPVSPFIDAELIGNSHMALDGTKINSTGFTYDHPECTLALVRAAVQFQIDQGIFPPILK